MQRREEEEELNVIIFSRGIGKMSDPDRAESIDMSLITLSRRREKEGETFSVNGELTEEEKEEGEGEVSKGATEVAGTPPSLDKLTFITR